MKAIASLVTAVLVLLAASPSSAEEVLGLELHVKRLSPSAIRVWVGDYLSSTAVVAFATAKGIVVVDTLGIPKLDAELRKIIARELGRSDFKVLINTHEHPDHTWGNAVYSDCAIVGHEAVAAGMSSRINNRDRLVEWLSKSIGESKEKLAKLDAASEEARKLKEDITLDRLNLETVKSEPKLATPTETFADRHTLKMGDTTFEMFYVGGMHSASDIAILVPELGILLTGDTMADNWLNETPGCLASFAARSGVPHDFPRWLANWDALLARKEQIRLLLPGHWNGELSLAGAEARVAYVRELWDGVQKAAAAGESLPEVQVAYQLESRFPALAESPGCSTRNNVSTIAEMWKIAAGQESAAERLYALIDEGAGEDTIRKVLEQRDARGAKYYFVESEINGAGYRFLHEDKVEQAIAMFKANAHLYPDSWNVYDSLGEALLKAGNDAKAVAMYEKSLALNPGNTNGKEVLAKLNGVRAAQ